MNSLKNRIRKFTPGGGKKANKLKLKKIETNQNPPTGEKKTDLIENYQIHNKNNSFLKTQDLR